MGRPSSCKLIKVLKPGRVPRADRELFASPPQDSAHRPGTASSRSLMPSGASWRMVSASMTATP